MKALTGGGLALTHAMHYRVLKILALPRDWPWACLGVRAASTSSENLRSIVAICGRRAGSADESGPPVPHCPVKSFF